MQPHLEIENDLVVVLNLFVNKFLMRWLFNHGLTPEELYTNTPKKIINRKRTWFIKNYGSTQSYEDAISAPFKYCFGLIMNKIIDDRVRFKVPVNWEAYIDFEIVTEDKFIKCRQNGRFQDIDFIESDFTGYALRYYFTAKTYQKHYQVYLGGDLKKKFIKGINSGIKYYSIRDFTINDVIDKVYDKFPDLDKKEVKNLIVHGFRRMHAAIKFGCGITINTTKYLNCYLYIGQLYANAIKQVKDYSFRRDQKLRKIEQWKREEFDGYYYIGLTPKVIKEWINLNIVSRTLLKFRKVLARKVMEELFYKNPDMYIFRINVKKFKGWMFWIEELNFRNVKYMGKVENYSFKPSDKLWKELIKTYETGNS